MELVFKRDTNNLVRDQLNKIMYQDQPDPEEESAYEKRIYAKIESGAKLSPKEMGYIRAKNPEMYMRILRVQMRREAVLQKLKTCKSKKQVEDVISLELGIISKKDPDKELLLKAIQSAVEEFKKSDDYKKLPEKTEEEEQGKKKAEQISYECLSGQYQTAYISDTETSINLNVLS